MKLAKFYLYSIQFTELYMCLEKYSFIHYADQWNPVFTGDTVQGTCSDSDEQYEFWDEYM